MACCSGGGRNIKVNPGEYLDNFKYLSVKQMVKQGKYKYCYKCEKYHKIEEYKECNKVG